MVIPSGIVTTGWPAVEAKCRDLFDVKFDRWQDDLGRVVLGKRADGIYAATIGGVTLSIPRQVAKTWFVLRILFALCILFPGLKCLWTAHHGQTLSNTFRAASGLARRKKVDPYIGNPAGGSGVLRGTAKEAILFKNGSAIYFGSRDQGFGRGFEEVDVEVFDECQILNEKALDDMVAATMQTRHPHGALLFYMGTPPRPTDPGEVFTSRRADAISGESEDAIYVECSADPDADPDDHAQWRKANPSFPKRTPLRSMLRLRKNLRSDESWKREALGIWDKTDKQFQVISGSAWGALAIPDDEAPEGKPSRYALAMSPERVASIAVAIPGEAASFLDLAELSRVDDSRKIIDWLVARCGRRIPVMIDSRDPAAAFINDLRSRGVKVNATTQSDAAKACTGLLQAVEEARIWHVDQPAIRAALRTARKKPIGKAGLWEWDPEDPTAEMAALRALTLAHFGLSLVKKRTGSGRSTGNRRAVAL